MRKTDKIWNAYQELDYSKKQNNEAFCYLYGALEYALAVMENESDKEKVITAMKSAVDHVTQEESK